MNMPFPVIKPHFTFPDWFNADNPYDEDAELTKLEQSHHNWLTSFSKRYMKHPPIVKPDPAPVAEVEIVDEAGDNEDPEESEESHDEEEHIPTVEPDTQNDIVEEANIEDEFVPDVEVLEVNLWRYNTVQDE